MKLRALFVLSMAGLWVAVAAPSQAATPATYEGLVSVRSWNLDELYLRPNADLRSYRKVVIDPVQVVFREDWNRNFVDPHAKTRRLMQDDVRRIADETAATMQSAVAEEFKARGYEIAAAPGPGVLRLSPTVTDLYVNAAENLASGPMKSFTKDAGEATLVLEARDSVSGTLLGRVVDRRTVREGSKGTQIGDVRRTSSVTNNFWFETTFRRWAAACIKEFQAVQKS